MRSRMIFYQNWEWIANGGENMAIAFNPGMNQSKARRAFISIAPGCVSYRGLGRLPFFLFPTFFSPKG